MFKKAVINIAFKLINTFLIAKITFAPLREWVKATTDPLKNVAEILTDSNPEDGEQLKALWFEHNDKFTEDTIQALRATIELKVEDEDKKQVLVEILNLLESELLEAFEGPNK